MGGCGKDTFANYMEQLVHSTIKISSIDPVKKVAEKFGWKGDKTEKDRKFLSDLKCVLTNYNDMPFIYLKLYNAIVPNDDRGTWVLLMDIREPEEIERAKKEFNAKTILIVNDRVPHIHSNMADDNVFNYTYDITIENNGSFEEFEANIRRFVESEGLYEEAEKIRNQA
jgi:hypothetical protein